VNWLPSARKFQTSALQLGPPRFPLRTVRLHGGRGCCVERAHETARLHRARCRRRGGMAARGARAAADDAGRRAPPQCLAWAVRERLAAFRQGL
jgi:hypothetical protein